MLPSYCTRASMRRNGQAAFCLRVIIANAKTVQYSPNNFAKKIVRGDTHAS